MALLESIRVAFEAIWANKLRAILTMLGVIIGVASVIIMTAILQGFKRQIMDQMAGNGANLVFAFYQQKPGTKAHGGTPGFSQSDLDAIERRCSLITDVDPDIQSSGTVHIADRTYTANLVGATSDFVDLRNITMASGRFFDDDDNANVATVCVIGDTINQNLFPHQSAVGQTVFFDTSNTTVALTVIGVLDEKDRGGFGTDVNTSIIVPIRSAELRVTGSSTFWDFTARSIDVSETETAADQIWAVMKEQHKLNYQDYVVDTQEGLLKQINVVLLAFQLVFGGVAGLSLLTGGIGIMNIMLVSVTERTREIGIRKAVGAPSGAIMAQFVVEAVTVSSIGGAIGTAIGYGVSALIDHVAHKNLPTYVPLWAVFLGVGFAAAVGMFFGIYPAFRASRLNPIDALRHD